MNRVARYSGWLRLPLLGSLGAVAALGQAPWGMPFATVAALVAMFLLPAARPRVAFINGWAFGAGYFALALHWITQPFMVDVDRYGWMAPFALVLLAGGLALFWGGAFALARAAGGGKLALVTCWTVAELARSLLFTGFPWALIGHVWIDTPLAQLAAFVGPHGLTLLTLAAAAIMAQRRLWKAPVVLAPIALAPVVLAGIGWWALNPGPAFAPDASAPLIRLVQPNVPQSEKWDPDLAMRNIQRMLALSAGQGEGPAPAGLVIWPESSVPWIMDQAQSILQSASQAAGGVPVILGIPRRDGDHYYNALALLDPTGTVSAVYDKTHLAPFGEYIPFGDLLSRFGIHGLADTQGGGWSAGIGLSLIEVPGIGPVLPLICYEGIFAEEVNAVQGRARLMVLITNDAWFGTDSGPYQHFALARLRAIEQGLPLARVANTGVSGMIDARGRVLGQIGLGQQAELTIALPPALPPTLYVRLGDWPVQVLLVLLGLALILGRLRDVWRITVDPIGTGD